MKLNIQVGVEQAKGMHGVTCWRLGLCNMDFKYIMKRMGGPEFAEEKKYIIYYNGKLIIVIIINK